MLIDRCGRCVNHIYMEFAHSYLFYSDLQVLCFWVSHEDAERDPAAAIVAPVGKVEEFMEFNIEPEIYILFSNQNETDFRILYLTR